MHYKPYFSQNEHWLVPKCVLPLEACEDSSSQHGLVGDARANPVGVLGSTVHPGLPLEVLFGVGLCYRL
jgi:hypothetical protein